MATGRGPGVDGRCVCWRDPGKAAVGPIAKAPGRVAAGIAAIGSWPASRAPWAFENVVIESLGPGGWMRGAAFCRSGGWRRRRRRQWRCGE